MKNFIFYVVFALDVMAANVTVGNFEQSRNLHVKLQIP